jgi:hypothetical protein
LFWEVCWNELPEPQAICNLINDEHVCVRVALKNKERNAVPTQVNVNNSVHVSPELNFAPQPNVSLAPLTEVAPGDPPTSPATQVPVDQKPAVLSDWAVGTESANVWWLFRKHGGKWRQFGKVQIPPGLPERAMQFLAGEGGSVEKSQIMSELSRDTPHLGHEKRMRRVTDTLAKAKSAIRKAVAVAGKYQINDVDNPIPNDQSGWITTIEIGFAVADDNGRLQFKRREDM